MVQYAKNYMMRCLPVVYTMDNIRGMLVICQKETKEILNANDLLALIKTDLDKPETKAKESEQKEYGYLREVIFIWPNGNLTV